MADPTIHDLFNLTGKTALVTGATGYLGQALSAALAEAGCQVVVSSRDLSRAEAAAQQLPAVKSGPHLAVTLDHMDKASLDAGFDAAIRLAGKLDILLNNGHEGVGVDWTKVTGAQFSRQLANATGYFLLARRLRDHAVSRSAAASIVMLGSMYGMVGSYPDAYEGVTIASPAAYHALKGGIIHLTRHLAVYWAKDQVRVNCLSPGPFPSEKVNPQMVERLIGKSPMGRMGQPHELKGAVVFLVSDAASYMTGQNVVIDGGWTAW